MYQLIIGIQCVSIAALLLECIVVFRSWRGKLHSYLFLSCAATLVNDVGYLLQLTSFSEEPFFTAVKFSYMGRIWIAFALLAFITELVGVKLPKSIQIGQILMNVVTYGILITTRATGLYYKNIRFEMNGQIPDLEYDYGIWHHIWDATIALYIVAGISLLVRAIIREDKIIVKKRLIFVLFAMVTESVSVTIGILKPFHMAEVYDFTMLGFPLAAAFMFIAILKYNLLDVGTLAREYVIDKLSEGVIATDEEGDVSFYNKPALALFPELKGDSRSVVEMLRDKSGKKEPVRFDKKTYAIGVNTLYQNNDASGEIYSVRDETQIYHYMDELTKQKQIADDANNAKSTFLASMSHEIRTPINAILGMDEMILRESAEKRTLDYASDTKIAGKTLLVLINDILDFSKIEEGRMELLLNQYELAALLKDLINMVHERADKKGLELEIVCDSNIPRILVGDEARIMQIVMNLLANAVKYTDKGRVKLEVDFDKVSEKEIMLGFKISDTGVGLKEKDMEKLVNPFLKKEERKRSFIEGSGLGMPIVRQLLALMGSKINVSSTYGEGSEFSFEIKQEVVDWEPIGDITDRLKVMHEDNPTYRELFHAPDARILVIDDTEINLIVVENLLKRTQIKVDTAISGLEALQAAEKNTYDVIFIDHMMPGMDGIETLNKLRFMDGTENTIFIALTANAIAGARQMYLEKGFIDYLSKPVDGKGLEEMLLKYLPEEKVIMPTNNRFDRESEKPQDNTENNARAAAYSRIPEWIAQIPEIDISQGISNCGDENSYLFVLKMFHETAGEKADEIKTLADGGDYENYTIKVHALKSTARIIGANELSEMARRLEEAGRQKDQNTILGETDTLIDKYMELDGKLLQIDSAG